MSDSARIDPKIIDPNIIVAEIMAQTAARGSDKSICPSEVARALGGDEPDGWRRYMHAVRQHAARLAEAGRIDILRKGKPIAPGEMRGVIRLRIRSAS